MLCDDVTDPCVDDLAVRRLDGRLPVFLEALCHAVDRLQLALQLNVAVVEAARRQHGRVHTVLSLAQSRLDLRVLLLQEVDL